MYLKLDVNKVLNSKAPKIDPIKESFDYLKLNQTPINTINFMSKYKKSSKDTILENMTLLCDINSDITFSYFNDILEVADLSNTILDNYKSHISSLLKSTDDEEYSYRLKESIDKIDNKISNNNDIDVIREDMLLALSIDRIRKQCVFESYLEDELEVLVYNINTSPETIYEYEKLIRKIKVSNTTEYFYSFPMLLVKNTDLIKNVRVKVSGDVLDLLTSLPIVIANKLCETNLSKSTVNSYIKVIDKQIAIMYNELKHNEPKQYQLYSTYVKNLVDAKRKISEKYYVVEENISEMQPDIVLYDEGVLEDVIAEMEDSITNIIFNPNEEIDEVELENLTRLSRIYEASTNRVQKGAIKAGHKLAKGTQKAINTARSVSTDVKRSVLPVKKATDPLVNAFNNTINKLKEMDKKERTERIITGEYRLRLVNFIKRGIIGLASLAVGTGAAKVIGKMAISAITPARLGGLIITAIGLLVGIAIDKKIDSKHRQRILIDLKNELAIVEEKIDDAKSDGKRAEKYELMRIQQKLKKDIEKIEYNLK